MSIASVMSVMAVVPLTALAFQTTPPSASPSAPTPSQADIDAVLTQFVAAAKEYQRVFRNLVAEETKVAEVFEQSGRLKQQRTIVADLLVYRPTQSPGDGKGRGPNSGLKMLGFSSSFMRGRIWIDADSFQLRRDRWELAGIHPKAPDPLTIVRRETSFTESRFDILVPERAVVEFFERGKQTRNQPPTFFRAARTTFTYTAVPPVQRRY